MNYPAEKTTENPKFHHWFALEDFTSITSIDNLRKELRSTLKKAGETISTAFEGGDEIDSLVRGRSWLIDHILQHCWQTLIGDDEGLSLVAVGGYGRQELLPGSDIDLLLLLSKKETREQASGLETFLTLLWDIGLEVGHSVRTLEDCDAQSREDITVITNLQEARLLAGNQGLFEAMQDLIEPENIWPADDYFEHKLTEQRKRHERFNDAVADLEPNVKEGPGGLRDIHMIGWVVKRHFGSNTLDELVLHGFLTEKEYETLTAGQHFLWKVRFGLHQLAGRREDRLLFDYQRDLAALLGYKDVNHKQAVELFMKDYYLTILEMSRLNEMLLQLFNEAILHGHESIEPVLVNRRFQARRGYLEAISEDVFSQNPFALLEVFLLMAQHPQLKGVTASTIRLIRDNRQLINDNFRDDIRAKSLFIELFRQPHGLTHELRRMHRYGILAAYYPAFDGIVGQMQYDLFHVYTVDEHTLFVIRNLRRFSVPEHAQEFPFCSQLAKSIAKPELLYLAGLFHDIAKGRGGDHSTIGAEEARKFMANHNMDLYAQDMVSWLVDFHLMMSQTAQREDISDPEVINRFASSVGNRQKLDYLYLLTVADICGTSPTLWNSWKDSLLKQLYSATRQRLRFGSFDLPSQKEIISKNKQEALSSLLKDNISKPAILSLWLTLPDEYFLRHNTEEIIWHSKIIIQAGDMDTPQVDIRSYPDAGSSSLFLYTPHINGLFHRTMSVLEKLQLTITDARIITSADDFAINTYHLLNSGNTPLHKEQIDKTLHALNIAMNASTWEPDEITVSPPRRLKHFDIKTRISFELDEVNQNTIMELVTADRPGLLSSTAQTLNRCGILLKNAKIATYGSQAEDYLYLTNSNNMPLNSQQQDCIKKDLITLFDETN